MLSPARYKFTFAVGQPLTDEQFSVLEDVLTARVTVEAEDMGIDRIFGLGLEEDVGG